MLVSLSPPRLAARRLGVIVATLVTALEGCGSASTASRPTSAAPTRVNPAPTARAEATADEPCDPRIANAAIDRTDVRVVFDGNREVSSSVLRCDVAAVMREMKANPGAPDPLGDWLNAAGLALSAVYYNHGFLSMTVEREQRSEPGAAYVTAFFHVDEHERYRLRAFEVRELDASNNPVTPLGGQAAIDALVATRAGGWFSRAALARDQLTLQRHYLDAGYGKVKVQPDVQFSPAEPSVAVRMVIVRGPLVHLGSVDVVGNHQITTEAIRARLLFAPGELYNQTRLDQSRARLLESGRFARVDIWAEADPSHDDQLRIHVELVERAVAASGAR